MIARPIAVAVLSAAVMSGCVFDTLVEGERRLGVEHVLNSPVDVATGNGSVRIEQADQPRVDIVATIRARSQERLDATDISATRADDGTLVVRAVWPDKRRGNESCAFVITVPDAEGITARTDNGSVTIAGLAGQADLETDNGAIEVLDHDGPVSALTDNGRITIRKVPHPVLAETDNGSIELDGVATPAHAHTDNGRIEIVLTDDAVGPVDAYTDNGRITVLVGPGFTGTLEASTDNGSVSGGPLDASRTTSGSVLTVMDFGPGEASRVESDNGSVSVHRK